MDGPLTLFEKIWTKPDRDRSGAEHSGSDSFADDRLLSGSFHLDLLAAYDHHNNRAKGRGETEAPRSLHPSDSDRAPSFRLTNPCGDRTGRGRR